MSKPNKKRLKLEQILQKREEVTGGRDIEFEYGGKVYTFPHPSFATDEYQDGLAKARTPRELGVAVLGDHYEQFHADGGQASFLKAIIDEVTAAEADTAPDGTPTQSSTS